MLKNGASPADENDTQVNPNDITNIVANVLADTDALLLNVSVTQTRRLGQEQEKYSKEIIEQISAMGLKFEDLSPAAQADFNLIAGIASTLGVSEPTLPKILVALSEIGNKRFQYGLNSLAMEDEEARLSELHQSQMTVQFQLKRLQEETRSKDAQMTEEAAQSKQQHEFFQKKCSHYMDSIQSCLASLQKNGFSDEISHQNLCERRKKLEEMQAKVTSLKTELESYQNLSPNIDMAKVELEKCKEELRRLDEEITARASDPSSLQY